MKAMKKANPKAVWVAQAWQANPRPKMIENLKAGDLLILDLTSECRPQWGDSTSRVVSQERIRAARLDLLYAFELWWQCGIARKDGQCDR